MIRRQDYSVDIAGGNTAAHYLHEHKEFGGIVFPTRRRIYPRRPDQKPNKEVTVHRKPTAGTGLRPVCTRFVACVMSAYFYKATSMTDRDQQLSNSTTAPAGHQHDAHRAIANEWLQRTINGIKEMHLNEDARREVARGVF